jgi:delta
VGNCCNRGYRTENNIELCADKCQTFFRVCLKHYQTNIDPSPPCTFGEVITPVFNDSSVLFKDNNRFDNTIRFPFNFSWPVSIITVFYYNLFFHEITINTETIMLK